MLRRIRWKRLALFGALGTVIGFVVLVSVLYAVARIPQPNDIARGQRITVVDDKGRTIGGVFSEANRVSIPIAQMPPVLRDAVIATEDRHFYSHHGVQVTSIFRAALANLFRRGISQGGSTITQQYVKNAFLTSGRTFSRKLNEAVLAIKLERKWSKNKILEAYLNTIYFGRGAYGCEAAAQAYFGVHAKNLSLPQAAMLAGLISDPAGYDPTREPAAATARRNAVLGFMDRDSYISSDQADRARAAKLGAMGPHVGGVAPYYMEDLRQFLEHQLGPQLFYQRGVTVTASLDLSMQRAAEDAVRSVYDRRKDPDAALVAIDPKTGAVRALVGGRDFSLFQNDVVMHGLRQPGSTFKPATLATYLDEGNSIRDRYKGPASISLGGTTFQNYDHANHGRLSVEEATWLSINTVYVQLVQKAGAPDVVEMAHRLGISSTLRPELGIALGQNGVKPLELAEMYATFAARGVRHDPFLVDKVTAADGRILFRQQVASEKVLDQNVADTVNHVLQGVIQHGTGQSAAIGRPAAGKTGTTEELVDAWFAGYTPDLAAVVWNGYPNNESTPLLNVHGLPKVFGGTFPARMWKLFMQRALQGFPPTPFATPTIAGSPSPSPSGSPSPSPTAPVSPSPTVSVLPSPGPSKSPKPSKSPTSSPSPSPTGAST